MNLIDFDGYKQNLRAYGGLSGRKVGITYHGENFLIKYPNNLKDKNLKNVGLSYANTPISEYIGSHIYARLGIPVHDTLLGKRNGKIVVACRDFLKRGEVLKEFRELKSTGEVEEGVQDSSSVSDGTSGILSDVLKVIEEQPNFKAIGVENVKKRFWDMFVIDAFIGNWDRNNGNWGVIQGLDGQVRLAPVYDNGGCLFNKWDEKKIQETMLDENKLRERTYTGVLCFFRKTNGKKINPFKFIFSMENDDCNQAILRLVPKIKKEFDNIYLKDIVAINQLSDLQKDFFGKALLLRKNKILIPTFNILRQKERRKNVYR